MSNNEFHQRRLSATPRGVGVMCNFFAQSAENATLKDENSSLKTQLQTLQKEYKTATDKLQAELKKIYDLFPNLRELLSIENLCQQVGFAKETIQRLLRGGKVSFSERLFSSEHKRRFATENSIAQIVKIPDKPGKLRLTIDGVEITEWFRLKYREFQRSIGIDWAERSVGRGRKI